MDVRANIAISRDEFLNELCPQVRPLIARLMECDCGCMILDLFRRRPLTWFEASDIAYHVRKNQTQVVEALKVLVGVHVIEYRKILDFTFYGLSRDAEIQRALEQFWMEHDDWCARLERVRNGLRLSASGQSPPLPTAF